jgi:hypothetical protein
MGYRWYWTVDSDHVITKEDDGCFVRWNGSYYQVERIVAHGDHTAVAFWSSNPRQYAYHYLSEVLYARRIFLPKTLYKEICRHPFAPERISL